MLINIRPLRLLRGLEQFRGYRRGDFRVDVVVGVTVAAYLIPQVMAYATVAGLTPVTGLWAALGALVVYAVLGTSRQLSIGPDSATALLIAAALTPLAARGSQRYIALAAALALVVGVLAVGGAVARFGVLADLLSKPVLVGFLTGTAIVMITGQLGTVTGVPVAGESFVTQLRSFCSGIGHWQPATTFLAAGVLVALLLQASRLPRVPGPLLTVLLAAGVVAIFSLQRFGIEVIGPIPSGIPIPSVAGVRAGDLGRLVLPAAGITVVGFSDAAVTGRAFAARHGEHLGANSELGALGLANIAAGLLHGFPVSCSGSRTAIADAMGARTQLYSIVTAASLVAVLLWAGGVIAILPTAALGALVVYAALLLIDMREFRRLARFRRSELLLALGTTAAVLAAGMLYGLLIAIGLTVLELLRRIARAHDAVLGFVPGLAGMHDVDDYPAAKPIPGLMIYRYDAPLCFANADDFRSRALAAVDAAAGDAAPVRWFVLNAEANVEVDLTALDALGQLSTELASRGVVFAMARVKQDLRAALEAAGLVDQIGADHIYPTLPTAVSAYQRSIGPADHDGTDSTEPTGT